MPRGPRKLLWHSAVNKGNDLWPYFARSDVGAESTFYVDLDGGLDQFMDTEVIAHANVAADLDAISVETADDGDPDRQPWNDAQLATMERLARWVLDVHPGVVPEQIPYPAGAGIGWHSMFRDGGGWSPWSHARGKTCPGAARIAQIPGLLARILSAPAHQEDDMADPRQIVRGPQGDVHLFDGATLRPANDEHYRTVLKLSGAGVPTSDDVATAAALFGPENAGVVGEWFQWTQASIDAVPPAPGALDVPTLAAAIAKRLPPGTPLDSDAIAAEVVDEIAGRLVS